MPNRKSKLELVQEYLEDNKDFDGQSFYDLDAGYELAQRLKSKMGEKIEFYGFLSTPDPLGKYLSLYRKNIGENMHNGHLLSFCFHYVNDNILRLSIFSDFGDHSLEEKMAALSEFYEVLRHDFDEPDIFYVSKNEDGERINLQWSFAKKDEIIKRINEGNYFKNKDIVQIIILGEKDDNKEEVLSEDTRKKISYTVGLPFELIHLIKDHLKDFLKYKLGKEKIIVSDEDVDDEVLSEKKLEKKINKM